MPQAQALEHMQDAGQEHDQNASAADNQQHDAARAQEAKKSGGINNHPGGNDSMGRKENLLAPFYKDMVEVAALLSAQFTPLGLHFRPEILLATAMQEAASVDPANARSFDNGLGIMQITPYRGQLGGSVAKAIGWDNSKGVEYNIQHSNWRDAKANILAGGYTMLGKAQSIKGSVAHVWEQMDEAHRWRAVLFAYNAGEGSAISALRAGGPNAAMISSYTYKGQRVSHDYTAEIKGKMDYVDGHDPFGGGGGGAGTGTKDQKPQQDVQKPEHQANGKADSSQPLHGSVGQGGANQKQDVAAVQKKLHERGLDPGAVDGAIGPHTLNAIKEFQSTFMAAPDGLIEPGKGSEHHLFFEHGVIHPKKEQKPATTQGQGGHHDQGGGGDTKVQANAGDLPRIMPGVKLTEAIIANYRVLVPYLPQSCYMTSGLRTDEDQANLIHRYYHSHGGPGAVQDAEQQREWLSSHYGMIIARVGSSPHRTGHAFDLSGAPLGEILAAVNRCKREKPTEFHLVDTIFERANNCLHVDIAA